MEKENNQWFKNKLFKLQKNFSNAEIFWNLILYSIFFITLVISTEMALALSSFGSLIYLLELIFLDSKNQLWHLLAWIFWAFAIIAIVGLGMCWIASNMFSNTIGRFNDWINLKK